MDTGVAGVRGNRFGARLAYTSGLMFYAWRRLPFNHAVWHMFVLGGSVCHFLAVALYALPAAAR